MDHTGTESHYLEKELHCLNGDWSNPRRLIPYGFGGDAKKLLKKIIRDFHVPFIVDQDASKWGQRYMGVEVVSPERLKDLAIGDKVVVTIAKRRFSEIKEFLGSYGLEENRDYCQISRFVMEWYWRYRREYCICIIDMALTTACTLKCKNCNMFIPYHKKPIMVSFESAKRSIDLLMERIDYVFSIGLLGGESMLNPDLPQIIRYIKEMYPDRIGSVNITTNSVAMPEQDLINVFRENEVIVFISDYTEAIGDRSNVDKLDALLKSQGVTSSIMYNRLWCSYGFPEHVPCIPEKRVREHMLNCDPSWRGLNDGRLYFCNVAWSAEKTGLVKLLPTDWMELSKLVPNEESSKRKVLEYAMGNMPTGYMSFCKICGGVGPDNRNYVLAGEQM